MHDDFTWCVQKAELRSAFIDLYANGKWYTWALTAVLGVSLGASFYLVSACDRKLQARNENIFYFWLMVAIPTIFGINQRFHPKHTMIRIAYMTSLMGYFFAMSIWAQNLYQYLSVPHLDHQVNTYQEMNDLSFHIATTNESFLNFLIDDNVSDSIFIFYLFSFCTFSFYHFSFLGAQQFRFG